jgi:predicted GNAT family acetyltransferase
MLIQHKQIDKKGMFYVGQDGAILAEMVYTLSAPDRMIIEHTEVDHSLEGKGVGKLLVETAVMYARTHDLKIVPLCPFAKGILDKVTEWQDVLLVR